MTRSPIELLWTAKIYSLEIVMTINYWMRIAYAIMILILILQISGGNLPTTKNCRAITIRVAIQKTINPSCIMILPP